jgi:hypothetical protein
MNLLNEDYLHLFLRDKIFVTEKFVLPETPQITKTDVKEETVALESKKIAASDNSNAFAKKILIAVKSKAELSEADFEFLHKILSACKLEVSDWMIAELSPSSGGFSELCRVFEPNLCVFFGNPGESFFDGREIFPYYLQKINRYTILTVEELSVLSVSAEKKKRLWQTLRLFPFHNIKTD